MKFRVFHFSMLTILLLLVGAVVACGGSGGNAEPTQNSRATATRRSPAPTRATSAAPEPTQDTLDDSADNSNQEPPATDGPRPTQDPLDDSTDNSNIPDPSESAPQVQDGNVVLTNTAWLLAGGERLYQFCKDGQWQVVQGGDTVEKRGTYQAEGKTLTLKNTTDNQETKYTMTWKSEESSLELKEGTATLTLEYDGTAACE